ncbi:putative CTP1-mitochondrial citrate transporter-member of the mitochondrial carrier family [Globomyces pollinis-pini]|nr:putative CTP1-mitochondrial citrate transporter-member of the mitochondrial carrier family [Globomyces pollinis-pini]
MVEQKNTPAWLSLTAGIIAGAVEGFLTYPTEYVKTQLQIQATPKRYFGPWDCAVKTVKERGFTGLYRGLSALLIGNAAKAGVRFLAYDQIKALFKDKNGKLSGTSMVLAGLGAGICEGVLVVTPSETIKTKLIHDQNQPVQKYRGLVHGVRTIIAEEGFSGIYRGVSAVVARQGANSAVRMSSYGLIRQRLSEYYPTDSKGTPIVPWYTTFFTGAIAGVITVYTTMPLDVVKTRLQSLDAKQYSSFVDCVTKVIKNEGLTALWKGATPRLGRLIFSGGIVFTVYEGVISVYHKSISS